MSEARSVPVAIVGCGVVGSAAARVLTRDRALLEEKCRRPIELRYIVSRTYTRAKEFGLDSTLFEPNYDRVLADPELQIVIELIGGIEEARAVIERAIDAGKHVVTANKALLALHGPALFERARSAGVAIGFEASCAGGIPIVRALYDGLVANRIDAIYAIVNGTCNYILSQMTYTGESYQGALRQAQADGLAEADPTLDVSGLDSAHKIAIMTSLAFGWAVPFDMIPVEGIEAIKLGDVQAAEKLGYLIKLLAIAERQKSGITVRVRPAFISRNHPLAWVSGPFNAVSVYGHITGHTMYYGRGAGGAPTASAVVADLLSIASGVLPRIFSEFGYMLGNVPAISVNPVADTSHRYYLRVMVRDSPGALASMTSILERYGISIASVLQDEVADTNGGEEVYVPVVIILHTTVERAVLEAAAEINKLPTTGKRCSVITIVDEYPEPTAED